MRKVVLWFLSIWAVLALAIVIVPPFVNLNFLKPQIQEAILAQTGLHADIRGHVRLSLLGRATLSANDVILTEYKNGGRIDYVSFSIPLSQIFNLKRATIPNEIVIAGATLVVEELSTPDFDNTLIVQNSSVTFMGHTYSEITGTLRRGMFSGTLRTNEHKYTFNIDHDKFVITNPNVNLMITGQMETDNHGKISSSGTLSIDTDKINTWFAFDIPKITERVTLSMRYEWSGMDFHFYDITGSMNGALFSGDIVLSETSKRVKLTATDLNMDLSFIRDNPTVLTNSEFDVNLSGKLTFLERDFTSVKLETAVSADGISIRDLAFVGDGITGQIHGQITGETAQFEANIAMGGQNLRCDFVGNPDNWECRAWSLTSRDMFLFGTLTVTPTDYKISITSDETVPSTNDIDRLNRFFGHREGNISFDFQTVAGLATTSGDDYTLYYVSQNSSLAAIPGDYDAFLPDQLLTAPGALSVTIANNIPEKISFTTADWNFAYDRGAFRLTCADASHLFRVFNPSVETKFLRADIPITISGKYKKPYISDLGITLGDMEFAGLMNNNAITLKTTLLDMDALINPDYVVNYEAEQFLTTEPLTVPFALPFALTLSADHIRYDGNEYANFAYTLKTGSQKMSVTDDTRGHVLLTIDKELARYRMLVQINRFAFRGKILKAAAPLNIADALLTARAELITYGITSYDFWNNVRGDLDLTFEGGTFSGLGTDWFFANARNITRLNLGDAVSVMLDGGETALQSLHLTGRYENNDFETTAPFDLRARHTEITGNLKISGGLLSAHFDIILRGTSSYPETIYLDIFPDGTRDYSLFEISSKIDPDFLYNFITTHSRF